MTWSRLFAVDRLCTSTTQFIFYEHIAIFHCSHCPTSFSNETSWPISQTNTLTATSTELTDQNILQLQLCCTMHKPNVPEVQLENYNRSENVIEWKQLKIQVTEYSMHPKESYHLADTARPDVSRMHTGSRHSLIEFKQLYAVHNNIWQYTESHSTRTMSVTSTISLKCLQKLC